MLGEGSGGVEGGGTGDFRREGQGRKRKRRELGGGGSRDCWEQETPC